jgi:polar amino acid transport system substrate-binding protein
VLLSILLLFAVAKAQGVSAVDQPVELVYSTNPHYPPYDWSVDNKVFEGASVELLSLILPPGVTAKPVVYPWKRSLMLAREGEIDLLVSLRITPERSEYLEFSSHRAFSNPIVVFVRKDHAFPFRSREDLRGRKGGVSLGDTFGGGFDEYWPKALTIEVAPTMLENFRKLQAGRIDYFVSGYFLGRAYLEKYGLENEIMALKPPLTEMDIHIGFSRKSKFLSLLPQINQRLAELDRQGIPEQLLEKHLKLFRDSSRTDGDR